MLKIDSFDGEYAWLSNFYLTKIETLSHIFPSVEHAFQASKCANKDDISLFTKGTPGQAKRLGRRVPLREDWESVKFSVMKELLLIKFSNPTLKDKLLATKEYALIEGNYWHDGTYGICSCKKCSSKEQLNMLGKTLMEIRKELIVNAD
jgi:ribA/ribD-fused uncharacterized protein